MTTYPPPTPPAPPAATAGKRKREVMVTRIGMMLPGAVSLGAYEGGALAALLTAAQASHGELVIDAIASASAGSITGLIAARAILCGDDPIKLMRQTWVDLPSLKNLEQDAGPNAPLSMKGTIATAEGILGAEIVEAKRNDAQTVPVELSMALTALGGLTYSLVQQRNVPNEVVGDDVVADEAVVEPLAATTYVDWYRATLKNDSSKETFTSHIDGALASGSTPVGFQPRQLDRTDLIGRYQKNGIVTPGVGHPVTPWYSDGGDLDNQPLGRLLDLIGKIDGSPEKPPDWDRVIVMLNIEPGPPPTFDGTWFDAETPTWLSTLMHVHHIRSTQSLYDDLRALEKTNQRIRWIREIASGLGDEVDSKIPELAQRVAGQRAKIAKLARRGLESPPPPPAATLEALLRQAAGVADKREVDVHVISPKIDPSVALSPERQLSGEFLFHFGGFFDVKFRKSDFLLGYRNAQFWLGHWVPDHVSKSTDVQSAVQSGIESLVQEWGDLHEGSSSVLSLSFREKLEALKLFGHIERVVGHDLKMDVVHALEAAKLDVEKR